LAGAEKPVNLPALHHLNPEYDFDMQRVNELILEGRKGGARYDIVIVSEGAKEKGGNIIARDKKYDASDMKPLAASANMWPRKLPKPPESKPGVSFSAISRRGGAPCAYDRRMGRYFGIAAVT